MMEKWLIDDWVHALRKLWSVRVALFWSAVGAFIMVAPLVSDEAKNVLGPWHFGGILFLAGVSFGVARALKQPGTDGEG